MIYYKGYPDGRVNVVQEDGSETPLDPRNDLVNHSPDGFAWGYGGSGPSQLSLAILAHAVGDERALASYQLFKSMFVARLKAGQQFSVPREFVDGYVAGLEDRTSRERRGNMAWSNQSDIEVH